MSAFCTIGMLMPSIARATYIVQGYATITLRLNGATLHCNGGPPSLCCTINGNQIVINHWSGLIYGTLDNSVLPPVIPENYPIEFQTDDVIPQG